MGDSRKNPSAKDIKILFSKAAGRCSFRDCRKNIVLDTDDDGSINQIGQIAHIVAHSSKGPRGDENYTDKELNCYDNYILLCPTCHKIVDEQPEKYSVDVLRKIKTEHENWVSDQLEISVAKVDFAELEIAAKAISSGENFEGSDYTVISPEEKILKNGLGKRSRRLISMGLCGSGEVSKYLSEMSKLDPDFPDRLKNGFKKKYLELNREFSGDDLFMEMLTHFQGAEHDFGQDAARLVILTHMFEICEVFEK
ncbi:ABC-three component system protein [Methanoplanus limicola]|uniref:HNH endonuclease n=1 Tax=Methanoplanus limicola DSM 2279 TaxID=937775 RepID=H1Z4H2_9EURY|nr:ABC-three component system protein [Methanoplanus limicola]EHQ36720.1 hypothetical protein Metlim_2682 [Methanoplanus limicola DSM 2279]